MDVVKMKLIMRPGNKPFHVCRFTFHEKRGLKFRVPLPVADSRFTTRISPPNPQTLAPAGFRKNKGRIDKLYEAVDKALSIHDNIELLFEQDFD